MGALGEAIIMSTHNIGFYEEISKIITYHQISSNTHLISSAAHQKYLAELLLMSIHHGCLYVVS